MSGSRTCPLTVPRRSCRSMAQVRSLPGACCACHTVPFESSGDLQTSGQTPAWRRASSQPCNPTCGRCPAWRPGTRS